MMTLIYPNIKKKSVKFLFNMYKNYTELFKNEMRRISDLFSALKKSLKAGVGYIRKNKPQFWQFLFCTQAVKISRSS